MVYLSGMSPLRHGDVRAPRALHLSAGFPASGCENREGAQSRGTYPSGRDEGRGGKLPEGLRENADRFDGGDGDSRLRRARRALRASVGRRHRVDEKVQYPCRA